jgi:hypothetical protein
VTALSIAVLGWIVGTLVSVLYVLPSDQEPVREAPEWAGRVAAGNDPDPQVDPSYQRSTQRECLRRYNAKRKR